MTKSWRHEVSVDWLMARRDVLTASEIKGLLPEYKRMQKKPGTMSPGFFALCGAKLSSDIPDPESVGAAARGHIMEPYAIADWNNNAEHYYHWDDIIIKRNGIGFSPDALDIEQDPDMGVELWCNGKVLDKPYKKYTWDKPTRALEVKCYEPKMHMKCLLESKKTHEERWQAAVAFMVIPGLKYIEILWYCPEAPVPMYSERYFKKDLKEEIEIITGMVKMFHQHMKEVKRFSADWSRGGMVPSYTTDEIYQEYIKNNSEYFMNIR